MGSWGGQDFFLASRYNGLSVLQGDPTRLTILICLLLIEKRLLGVGVGPIEIKIQQLVLGGLIIYYLFTLDQTFWS